MLFLSTCQGRLQREATLESSLLPSRLFLLLCPKPFSFSLVNAGLWPNGGFSGYRGSQVVFLGRSYQSPLGFRSPSPLTCSSEGMWRELPLGHPASVALLGVLWEGELGGGGGGCLGSSSLWLQRHIEQLQCAVTCGIATSTSSVVTHQLALP